MLSFFPRDVLDEIWDIIESVSEGFPTNRSVRSVAYKNDDSAYFRFLFVSPDP